MEAWVVTASSTVRTHLQLHLVHSHPDLDPAIDGDAISAATFVDVTAANHPDQSWGPPLQRPPLTSFAGDHPPGNAFWGPMAGSRTPIIRPPAVPLVDRLTSGKPSAGAKPTTTRTETAAPTAVIKLSEHTHTHLPTLKILLLRVYTHHLHLHPLFVTVYYSYHHGKWEYPESSI